MNENTKPQEAEVVSAPVPAAAASAVTPSAVIPSATTTAEDEYKKQALIAWAAAPFYSPTLKKSESEFVRTHAEASYYFGISALAALVGLIAFNFIFWNILFNMIVGGNPLAAYNNFSTFNMIGNLVSLVVWGYVLAPRAYAALKVQNMEVWSMPKVKELVSKYIKF